MGDMSIKPRVYNCIRAVCRSSALPQNASSKADTGAQLYGNRSLKILFFCYDSRLTGIWLKLQRKISSVTLKIGTVNMLTYSNCFSAPPRYSELQAWAEISADPSTSGSGSSWSSTLEKGPSLPSWHYWSTVLVPYGTFPATPEQGSTENTVAASSAWGFPLSFELRALWISSQSAWPIWTLGDIHRHPQKLSLALSNRIL